MNATAVVDGLIRGGKLRRSELIAALDQFAAPHIVRAEKATIASRAELSKARKTIASLRVELDNVRSSFGEYVTVHGEGVARLKEELARVTSLLASAEVRPIATGSVGDWKPAPFKAGSLPMAPHPGLDVDRKLAR